MTEAGEKEWQDWKSQRETGIEEIRQLRRRVADDLERKKAEKANSGDTAMDEDDDSNEKSAPVKGPDDGDKFVKPSADDAEMDVDDGATGDIKPQDQDKKDQDQDKKDGVTMQGDDDDAVEY